MLHFASCITHYIFHSPPVPVMELVAGWNLARDVDDHRFSLPPPNERLFADVPVQEFLRKLDAGILDELRVRLEAAIQRHRDLPGPREHLRILDGDLIPNGIGC